MLQIKVCHKECASFNGRNLKVTIKFSKDEMHAVMGLSNQLEEKCLSSFVKQIFMESFNGLCEQVLREREKQAPEIAPIIPVDPIETHI